VEVKMSALALRAAIARGADTLRDNAVVLALFTGTLFFSALLLFSVQPIFAKMVLPTLGGSPSVWAVSMCFFQATLLAGYAYAHGLNRLVPLRIAPLVHLTLLAVALLALPFGLPEGANPPEGDAYFWLVGTLIIGVGLPFFAVSANAPLLQAWFARTGHPHAADPYFLYGASNLGSLLALLSYPVVVEPLLGLSVQAWTWTTGFVLLGLLVAGCALLLRVVDAEDTSDESDSAAPRASLTARQRLSWIGLALVPSGLLVAYTSYLSTDIASAPFVWVIPLATFLGTFVLVFRTKPVIPTRLLMLSQPILVALALLDIAAPGILGSALAIIIGFAAFFVTTMVAHTALYNCRPDSADLTEFYMWMSLGGVLGGVLAALIAPQIFNTIYEFPLLLVAGMLCRPGLFAQGLKRVARSQLIVPLVLTALVVIAALLFGSEALTVGYAKVAFAILVTATLAMLWLSRGEPIREVALVGVLGLAVFVLPTQLSHGHSERSFYGVHKVALTPDGTMRILSHGTTVHGAQRLVDADGTVIDPPRPATYYYDKGLMARGLVAARAHAAERGASFGVGIVGVGTGSLACYAKPEETWKFYEIDPLVLKLATDPKLFTFFSSCRPDADFVVGDARLTVARSPDGTFAYLVIDAFSSDAVPVHLLTREAIQMYLAKVGDEGVVAMHISNRHMDLGSSAVATARTIPGVHIALGEDNNKDKAGLDSASSNVLFLSRSERALAPLLAQPDVAKAPVTDTAPWTDDYSNVISAIWRKKFN